MFEKAKQGAVDLIRGEGPLNVETIELAEPILQECLFQGQPRIVFDLQRVQLIDSAGLELLLSYQKQCISRGGTMKLAGPGELCLDILKATDVVSHFELYENVLAAAGSFAE